MSMDHRTTAYEMHAAEPTGPLRLLRIDASARHTGAAGPSVTRELTDTLVSHLRDAADVEIVVRDVSRGLPLVDEAWVGANFTDAAERSPQQRAALARSDELVAELRAADVVVIGVHIYNFGIPAALKAWVDLVARARVTFRYTDAGVEGLLQGKRAVLVVASGGTPVGGDIDFASTYLRHVLGFLGISDVAVIAAERLMARGEEAVAGARLRIEELAASLLRECGARSIPHTV